MNLPADISMFVKLHSESHQIEAPMEVIRSAISLVESRGDDRTNLLFEIQLQGNKEF